MSKFLLKCLLASILVSVFIAVPIAVSVHLIEHKCFDSSKFEHLNGSILIAGDSHLQCALNPAYFSDKSNAVNISQRAETPFITYSKIKWLIESKQVNFSKVIFGLSYHTLNSAYYDIKLTTEYLVDYVGNRFSENFIYFKSNDLYKYYNKSKKDLFLFLFKNSYIPYMNNKFNLYDTHKTNKLSLDFMGAYYGSKKNNLTYKELDNTIYAHYSKDLESKVSKELIFVIEDLVALCKANEIELFFVNAPIHQDYLKAIPKEYKEDFDSAINVLRINNQINYLNYTNIHLDDTLYGDFDHLNYYGARIFTETIDSIISNTIINIHENKRKNHTNRSR